MESNVDDAQMHVLLDSLERKLFLAKNEYERYFLGLIKIEPTKLKTELETIFRKLSTQRIKNTAENFRYQQLKARFSSLSLYWTRNLKKLEEGSHPRDQFRLKLRMREEEEARLKEEHAGTLAQQQKASRSPRQQPADTVANSKALRNVFEEFVSSRKRCKERTDNVEYSKMVDFMTKQTQALKDKYQCRAVHFRVVEEGGKTKLKVIPIR